MRVCICHTRDCHQLYFKYMSLEMAVPCQKPHHFPWLISAKLSNSPALLAEGLLRKSLACLCPQMDCQYSSCYLLVQSLVTSLATSSYVLRAGLCPAGGCEEPSLVNGFHFYQFLRHLAPVSVGSCYVIVKVSGRMLGKVLVIISEFQPEIICLSYYG